MKKSFKNLRNNKMSQEVVPNKCYNCNKIFATKYTLAIHQKTSKSCINVNIEKKTYDCEYCEKTFSSTHTLKYHLDICSEKKENESKNEIKILKKQIENLDKENKTDIKILKKQLEIKDKKIENKDKEIENKNREIISKDLIITKLETQEKQLQKQLETQLETQEKQLQDKNKQLETQEKQYQKQLEQLQETIERLAKTAIEKTTTTTVNKNTHVNNVGDLNLFFNEDFITEKINTKLTENDLYSGYKSIAQFIKTNIATNEQGKLVYVCVDVSRQHFCYFDDKGNEVRDIKAQKMIGIIKTPMQKKIAAIYEEQCQKQKALEEEKADENGREMKLCKFTIDKLGEIKIDIYGITDHNKLALEMAKVLYI